MIKSLFYPFARQVTQYPNCYCTLPDPSFFSLHLFNMEKQIFKHCTPTQGHFKSSLSIANVLRIALYGHAAVVASSRAPTGPGLLGVSRWGAPNSQQKPSHSLITYPTFHTTGFKFCVHYCCPQSYPAFPYTRMAMSSYFLYQQTSSAQVRFAAVTEVQQKTRS